MIEFGCTSSKALWRSLIISFPYGSLIFLHLAISWRQLPSQVIKSDSLLPPNSNHPLQMESSKPSCAIHLLSNWSCPRLLGTLSSRNATIGRWSVPTISNIPWKNMWLKYTSPHLPMRDLNDILSFLSFFFLAKKFGSPELEIQINHSSWSYYWNRWKIQHFSMSLFFFSQDFL